MKTDKTTAQQLLSVHSQCPEAYMFLGVRMKILLSAKETGGQFSLIEGVMPPGGDGGLHLHANEDESMHLLEGELEVTIGDKKFPLTSGESYFAPRNIPHRLRNPSQTPVRSLLLTTPGGFDAFISQAGIRLTDGIMPLVEPPTPGQMAKLLKLAEEFGIKIIAPPEAPPASNLARSSVATVAHESPAGAPVNI
jgi:mannose-6-phosphate isomerase-like protein (cupin superfamily)